MSLVNRMLTDLEARRKSVGGLHAVPTGEQPWRALLAVLALFILLALVLVWLHASKVPRQSEHKALLVNAAPPVSHAPASAVNASLLATVVAPSAPSRHRPVAKGSVMGPKPELLKPALVAKSSGVNSLAHPVGASAAAARPAATKQGMVKTPVIAKQILSPEDAKAQLAAAEQQFAGGHRAEGLALIASYWRASGEQDAARQRIIATLVHWNLEDDAVDWIRDGLQHEPHNIAYAEQMASWMVRHGRDEEAYQLLRGAQAEGGDAAYLLLLADAARRSGHANEAVDYYGQALRSGLAPQVEAKTLIGFALALEASGKRREALTAYQSAVQNPALPDSMRTAVQQAIADLQQNHAQASAP